MTTPALTKSPIHSGSVLGIGISAGPSGLLAQTYSNHTISALTIPRFLQVPATTPDSSFITPLTNRTIRNPLPMEDNSLVSFRASECFADLIGQPGNCDDPNDIVPALLARIPAENGLLEGRSLVIRQDTAVKLYSANTPAGGQALEIGELPEATLDAVYVTLDKGEKGDSMYRKLIAAANNTGPSAIRDKEVNSLRGQVAAFVRNNPGQAEAENRALENDPFDLLSTDDAVTVYNSRLSLDNPYANDTRKQHPEHGVFIPRPVRPWLEPLIHLLSGVVPFISNAVRGEPVFGPLPRKKVKETAIAIQSFTGYINNHQNLNTFITKLEQALDSAEKQGLTSYNRAPVQTGRRFVQQLKGILETGSTITEQGSAILLDFIAPHMRFCLDTAEPVPSAATKNSEGAPPPQSARHGNDYCGNNKAETAESAFAANVPDNHPAPSIITPALDNKQNGLFYQLKQGFDNFWKTLPGPVGAAGEIISETTVDDGDGFEAVYYDAAADVEPKAPEQVRDRSVRNAGSGNSIIFSELKPVYRLRSLPGNWVGGQFTLTASDGRDGSFTVLFNKYDASANQLQRIQENFNSLESSDPYMDIFFQTEQSDNVLQKEIYINSSFDKKDHDSYVLIISNEQHSTTPEESWGYSRRGIYISLSSEGGSLVHNNVKFYIPDLPPPEVLNCFPKIALAPFDDIPGMPGWFGGEVKLTMRGRTGSFTVFMENDGSELAEQWQDSLCNDNRLIHVAAEYLFAQLEGNAKKIETIKRQQEFRSMPDWTPATDFHTSSYDTDSGPVDIGSNFNYEYLDYKPQERWKRVKLKMFMVLNESSSSFGMSERNINGKNIGYGKPAVSLMFTRVSIIIYEDGQRIYDYHLQYNSYKSISIDRGFYLDFNVEDNALPAGWFSHSLNIGVSDDIGNIPFTGHLSASSDLKKLRLTSRELIETAGQNLVSFIINSHNDVSSFISIPGFSGNLSMSIQENKHSIDFNPGGETNQLILYPSDTPVFGDSMPSVVVNMGASVYENSVSFTFYRQLTINAPEGFPERGYATSVPSSCTGNFLTLQNGNCIGAVDLERPGIGTVTTDVQIKSPNSIPWDQFYRPEVQYLISSLLHCDRIVAGWDVLMEPSHQAIVTAYKSQFGNSTHVSIEPADSASSFPIGLEPLTSGLAFYNHYCREGFQAGEENMRLWKFRRDIPGNEHSVADINNTQIAISIVHDSVQAKTKIKYCLYIPDIPYIPQNKRGRAALFPHSAAATFCQNDYMPGICGWTEGHSILRSQSGNLTLDSLMFLSDSDDEVKDTLCSYDLLGTAAKLLQFCASEQNEQCQSIKTLRFNLIQQNLGLAESAVSLTVEDGSTTFPPVIPVQNNRLILSRNDTGQAGPNPAIVTFIDNDISSANFTIYQGGLASSSSLIPESLKTARSLKEEITVFTSNSLKPEGYRQIRAPAILAQDNVVLVCAEGRLTNRKDPGTDSGGIDIVCKRSVDSGLTFGPLKILATGADGYKGNNSTIDAYQPTMVMDAQGCYPRMYLLYNRDQSRPFYRHSDDLGQSWSAESDFRAAIKNMPDNIRKFGVNIASGEQLQDGKIAVPMTVELQDDPDELTKTSRPAVVYSADHGKTWEYGGHMASGANEHQLVEVFTEEDESRLLSSSRKVDNAREGITNRRIDYGKFDNSTGQWNWGGYSTPKYTKDGAYFKAYPVSAGTERYTRKDVNGETVNRLLFTLPHRMYLDEPSHNDLCVYISNDEGSTYPRSKLLHLGTRVGYSDIATLDGDVFLSVWEKGLKEHAQIVKLTIANRAFLEDDTKPECNEFTPGSSMTLFNAYIEPGEDATNAYRIPALQSAMGDYVFAFAEGRPDGWDPGRAGEIAMSAKFSKDGGISWSEVENISKSLDPDLIYDFSDARPIYNEKTGELMVVYTQWPTHCAQNGDCIAPDGENKLFTQTFDFNREAWNAPVDITGQLRERAWDARGWSGRASWTHAIPNDVVNADTSVWSYITERKVVQGQITDYLSTGTKKFVPLVKLKENNDLVVDFWGVQGEYTLIEDIGPANFYTSEIRFNPVNGTASYIFNGKEILTDWAGLEGSSTEVVFGNELSRFDGRASYKSVNLYIGEAEIISYDASVATAALANPEAQGWTDRSSGEGAGKLGWKSVNAGPGNGIQLKWQTGEQVEHNGRMIMPAIILDGFGNIGVKSVYSDDNGVTWDSGAYAMMPYTLNWYGQFHQAQPSEGDLVELTDGRLLLTARNDGSGSYGGKFYGPRIQFISDNGGKTWTRDKDSTLPDNIDEVDASLIRYSGSPANNDTMLLFSAPIGDTPGDKRRTNLGIWYSTDEGKIWNGPRQVWSGHSWYSDMTMMSDGKVGILVETGRYSISLLRKDISELLPESRDQQ